MFKASSKPTSVYSSLAVLLGGLFVSLLLVVVVTVFPVALIGIMAACVGGPIALLYFKRLNWALITFIVLLPFHSLLLTFLFAQLNLPISLVRAVAAWKEALLVGTFVAMCVQMLVEHRPVRLRWVDVMGILWLVLVLFYFVFQDVLFGKAFDLRVKLYGARDWLLYLLPYFAGRFIPASEITIRKVLRAVLIVGTITSLIGVIEYLFVPVEWHVRFGVPRYFSEFLGLSYPDYLSGLPPNYWAETPVGVVRRAVSTLLSGQGFAVPFLVILPAATYNYYAGEWTKRKGLVLVSCTAGLLLSFTRMTIVACFLQVLIMLRLLGKKKALARLILVAGFLFFATIVAVEPFRNYVVNTVTLSDSSSSARPRQWQDGFQALLEHPFGLGLGVTGQVGTRFNLQGAGQEAGFFMLTGAIGMPGLLFFLSWFAGVVLYSYAAFRRFDDARRGLALISLTAAIGFLINNLTAPPNQSPSAVYVFSWLAGMTVQQATLRLPQRAEAKVHA